MLKGVLHHPPGRPDLDLAGTRECMEWIGHALNNLSPPSTYLPIVSEFIAEAVQNIFNEDISPASAIDAIQPAAQARLDDISIREKGKEDVGQAIKRSVLVKKPPAMSGRLFSTMAS